MAAAATPLIPGISEGGEVAAAGAPPAISAMAAAPPPPSPVQGDGDLPVRSSASPSIPHHLLSPFLAAVLSLVALPRPPAISLLEIRVPSQNRRVPKEHWPARAAVASLLRAAARLAPERLVLALPPGGSNPNLADLDLPCFRRAASIMLESLPFVLGAPAAGGEFAALRMLHLLDCIVMDDDLDALLSLCPCLLVLVLRHKETTWAADHGFLDKYFLFIAFSHALLFQSSYTFSDEEANLAQEIEKHMVIEFSDLELHLSAKGHVLGALVLHILGMNQVRNAIRRFKVFWQTSLKKEVCPANCSCEPTDWRTQTISLTALEEVEIDGFEGDDHEYDLLELIFSCAPMLKRMTVKLLSVASTSSSKNACTKIYDIFDAHSSVECLVYRVSK